MWSEIELCGRRVERLIFGTVVYLFFRVCEILFLDYLELRFMERSDDFGISSIVKIVVLGF